MTELDYTWEWQPNDDLRATTPVLPAVRDLGDGRASFFNQLIAAFNGWKDTRNGPAKAVLKHEAQIRSGTADIETVHGPATCAPSTTSNTPSACRPSARAIDCPPRYL